MLETIGLILIDILCAVLILCAVAIIKAGKNQDDDKH